jgi:hypothetical protein
MARNIEEDAAGSAEYGRAIKEEINSVSKEALGLIYSLKVLAEHPVNIDDETEVNGITLAIGILKPKLAKRNRKFYRMCEEYKRWRREFAREYGHLNISRAMD